MKVTSRSSNSVDMLQVLRGFAAFLVFQGHVFIFGPPGPEDSAILQNIHLTALLQGAPWVGTWIFFTISGYLIGKGFYTKRYDFSPKGIIRFWQKRAIRIIPLYYFALFIAVVFVHPDGLKQENWQYILKMLVFNYDAENLPYNPNGTLWYVSTLMQFYIVAPILFWPLMKIRKRRQALFAALVIIILGFVLRLIPPYYLDLNGIWDYWGKFVYKPVYSNLDLFVIGFLVNILLAKIKYPYKLRRFRALAFLVLTILWIGASYWAVYFITWHDAVYSATFVFICPVLTSIITAFYLLVFEGSKTYGDMRLNVQRVKENPFRVFEVLGILSYGFYIWHALILETIGFVFNSPKKPYLEGFEIRFAWGFALSLCLAACTYVMIEKPVSGKKNLVNNILS